MKRSIFACVAGLVTWVVVVSVINRVLRLALPGYTVAEQTLQFTLTIEVARLLMAAITSLAAGAVTRWISPNRWVPLIVGGIVLAMFLPAHVAIWSKLPVWYHLTFLLTIVPLVVLGAQVSRYRRKDVMAGFHAPSSN
jgi:hypothetical protein